MNRLAKIALSGKPNTRLNFRRKPYGSRKTRSFLRDVLALANADVEGPRYIFIGVELDAKGRRRLRSVDHDDFGGKPSYQSLVAEFIEPPIRVRYRPIIVDDRVDKGVDKVNDKRLGVFEIPDCQDRPYMMRIDHSESLRRGDAFARLSTETVKLGRKQLQEMFEKKFRDAVSAERIEIGFPGEIIHKDYGVGTVNLAKMPSAVASAKLKQLLDVHANSRNTGTTTLMARLTHARLFGSDSPYKKKSPAELMQELTDIKAKHHHDDQHFLFEEHVAKLQLVIVNQGDEPIQDASLSIVLPNHNCLYVANRPPKIRHKKTYAAPSDEAKADYPTVSTKDDSISISTTIGTIACGEPLHAFGVPLRICVGSDLKGRRLGVRYSLFGSNLRSPAQGKLRLLF